MAKRGRQAGSSSLHYTAEAIGKALGHVAAKLDAWKVERTSLAAEVRSLMVSAQSLLGEVSDGDYRVGSVRKNKGGRPKGYKMSAATKAKLRAAWKRRKAAVAREG